MLDFRELAHFEEVNQMSTKKRDRRKNNLYPSGGESDILSNDERAIESETKSFYEDEKPYLTIEGLPNGDLRLSLLIPPFELEDIKAGYRRKLTFFFKERKLEMMRQKFSNYKSIVVFVDGSVMQNPGPAAGVAMFYGRKLEMFADSSSSDYDMDINFD